MSGYDVAVIGAGIVGLGVARDLILRRPGLRVVVLEKEERAAVHQSGHNTGVIHAGIYYRPGSLKASLCVRGAGLMKAYCSGRGVVWRECGKVVVAVNEAQAQRIDGLVARARENGVRVERVDGKRLAEIEPAVKGVAAVWSPGTGVTDYRKVAESMAEEIRGLGVEIIFGARVTGISDREIFTSGGAIGARYLVNCAGLYSDRVAGMAGFFPGVKIVPFRGEYCEIVSGVAMGVRGLVHPLAEEEGMPFLGVHLNRTLDGRVEAGPNAVLALAREGYRATQVDLGEALETATYAGFWRMMGRHWRLGVGEIYRTFGKGRFLEEVRRLVPGVLADELKPGRTGVRAQAVSKEGKLLDDFCFERNSRGLHVLNAPSPAATASLAIGEHVGKMVLEAV